MEKIISSPSEQFSVVASWQAGGQSQKVFCEEQAISYYSFRYRFKKCHKVQGLQTKPKITSDFLPIALDLPIEHNSEHQMTLFYPNGVQLTCPSSRRG